MERILTMANLKLNLPHLCPALICIGTKERLVYCTDKIIMTTTSNTICRCFEEKYLFTPKVEKTTFEYIAKTGYVSSYDK